MRASDINPSELTQKASGRSNKEICSPRTAKSAKLRQSNRKAKNNSIRLSDFVSHGCAKVSSTAAVFFFSPFPVRKSRGCNAQLRSFHSPFLPSVLTNRLEDYSWPHLSRRCTQLMLMPNMASALADLVDNEFSLENSAFNVRGYGNLLVFSQFIRCKETYSKESVRISEIQ